nr:MAG TPA: hypothetical protein [Caudoviricetes sp.]
MLSLVRLVVLAEIVMMVGLSRRINYIVEVEQQE